MHLEPSPTSCRTDSVYPSYFLSLLQPNYDLLEREVEKRKVALQDAKLKAKGLNPDGTPALSTMGGFSPASKPGTEGLRIGM